MHLAPVHPPSHDRFVPDRGYQQRITRLIASLDTAQAGRLLGLIADRWQRPADVAPAGPHHELFTKYTLEGLLAGPERAWTDFSTLLDQTFATTTQRISQ